MANRKTREALPQGIASGDVTSDSVVLWANTPEDEVTFRVFERAADGSLTRIARQKVEMGDGSVPAKVALDGLQADTDYLYRVRAGDGRLTGTFTTADDFGRNGLTFGITGDWRGELAPYPAVGNAADAELAFLLLGGDTIYADYPSPASGPTITLEGYRAKHSEVYSEHGGANVWADLRQTTPVLVTIDDHEIINDFAGYGLAADDDRLPETTGRVNDTAAYDDGIQAFLEYNPIRDLAYGDTGDDRTAGEPDLYRAQTYAQDAAVFMLDQRSFRDQQIDGVVNPTDTTEVVRFLTESFDPTRTLLGDVQKDRLKADLLDAEANGVTWKFIYTPEPLQDLGLLSADSWEGYQAERVELLKFIDDNSIDNVVFVAADIHATFVNNITYAEFPGGPQIATDSFEITTGSVAFDPSFATSVIEVATALGLLSAEQKAFYDSLPIAPDNDGIPNDKDDFVTAAFNALTLTPRGLDPLGLDNNLPQAEGLIDATLLQGGWVSSNTFGWTQFDIDKKTQALTVTTWGIDGYSEAEITADPAAILAREPRIVSQFSVNPSVVVDPARSVIATAAQETHRGERGVADTFVFAPGTSTPKDRDVIRRLGDRDQIDLTAFDFAEVLVGTRADADADTLVLRDMPRGAILIGDQDDAAFRLRLWSDAADALDSLIL